MIRFFNSDHILKVFWVLFGLTLLLVVGMQVTGKPLITTAAPGGIVSFELVGNFSGSQSIVQSWQGLTRLYAGLNMGLDFLFLALYSLTIALGCHLMAERLPAAWQQTGIWLGYGVLVAALLDIVENLSLINILLGSRNELLPQLARWCALPKFVLILLALVYLLAGIVPLLKSRRQANYQP
jgi:hypothetical protein